MGTTSRHFRFWLSFRGVLYCFQRVLYARICTGQTLDHSYTLCMVANNLVAVCQPLGMYVICNVHGHSQGQDTSLCMTLRVTRGVMHSEVSWLRHHIVSHLIWDSLDRDSCPECIVLKCYGFTGYVLTKYRAILMLLF